RHTRFSRDWSSDVCSSDLKVTGFQVMSFNYPKEIQDMINKSASHGMVGDVGKYQQISVADAMGKSSGSNTASDMAGMMMGMNIEIGRASCRERVLITKIGE